MISRNEFESFHGKVSDEQWAKINKQISDIIDRIYEEDHPLDD